MRISPHLNQQISHVHGFSTLQRSSPEVTERDYKSLYHITVVQLESRVPSRLHFKICNETYLLIKYKLKNNYNDSTDFEENGIITQREYS
jgi:hypothetical protein